MFVLDQVDLQGHGSGHGSSVCSLVCKRIGDQPSRPAHSFVENLLPLLLIQEEQVISYWLKNWH